MLQVKVPQSRLEEALLVLHRQSHQRDIWMMGVSDNSAKGIRELLYHDRLGSTELTAISQFNSDFVPVLVQTTEELNSRVRYSFQRDFNDMPVGTGLLFETNGDNMQVFYILESSKDADDPAVLSIPGPYMEHLLLLPLNREEPTGKSKEAVLISERSGEQGTNVGEEESRYEYDRLAGAIGLGDIDHGFDLLARAQKLVVVIIGAGRAGSRLAFRLAQEGVGTQGALVIVDPDMTTPSNLEGMIVLREAVGFPKVYGVGKTIAAITGGTSRPTCLYMSLSDPDVQDVLRIADFVFTAVDEPAPRLATAILAARYHVLHNRNLQTCWHVAQSYGSDVITLKDVQEAFYHLQIDELGLDHLDRSYLKVLLKCGRTSLGVLSSKLSLPPLTIQRVVEPYLLKDGFIVKDKSTRVITQKGKKHIENTLLLSEC